MKSLKKAASIALIIALVINLTLFAARVIHALQFWLIVIIAALFAFFVLPRIKK